MTEEPLAVKKTEYYQICCCLVALLIFRNSSRSGLKLYMVELAPEAILNVNGGQGERKRLADLESDKIFQYPGTKVQVFTDERNLMNDIAPLREKMEIK